MNNLNFETLRELALVEGKQLVSLFASMQRAGREVRQNEIRWKNILKDARQQLLDAGLEEDAADKYLKPANDKVSDAEFWQHQSDGLAMFLSDSGMQEFSSPISFEQKIVVANQYHLRPLLPIVNDGKHCFVLATSPNRVRLLEIVDETIEDVEPKDLPDNLRDALNIDEYVTALQCHSISDGSANGKQAAAFHGHGGSDPDVKKQDEILQYFHRLDNALSQYFGSEDVPLVFAGVDYLFPIFQQACNYKNLHPESVGGNPDKLSPAEILQLIRPIMNQFAERRNSEIVSIFQDKAHTDWASKDPNEIYIAAKMGQVESLILSSDFAAIAFLDEGGSLEFKNNSKDQPAFDVGNLILIEVLRNGGHAIELCKNDLPGETKVAAVFRSPVGKYANEPSSS